MLERGISMVGAGPDCGLGVKTLGFVSKICQITTLIMIITPQPISRIGPIGIGFMGLIIGVPVNFIKINVLLKIFYPISCFETLI